MEEHHYLIRGGIAGRERLRLLARVMRPGTLALLDLLTPFASAISASSAFFLVASSLCSFVQTFGGEGGVADERFDLGLPDLRGLPFFLATRTRVRAVLEPRQMRSSARSAAHWVTVADLFL